MVPMTLKIINNANVLAADTIAFTEGGAEAMRINSDGNVALAGNIGLGGATPTTSGTGITFPASASASTNANTLDDYEEGTWSPRYSAASGGELGGTQIASAQYTKIGRLVTIQFALYVNVISLSGKSGNVTITGLPFTANSGLSSFIVINSPSTGAFNSFSTLPLRGVTGDGVSFLTLYTGFSSGAEVPLNTTNFYSGGGNSNYVLISATYGTTS